MNVVRFINYPVSSNSYVIYDNSDNKECIIIDPGSKDCTQLNDFIFSQSLIPKLILLTHEHFDHIWGVNALKDKYNVQVVCSKKCFEKISIPQNYFNLLYYNSADYYKIDNVEILIEEVNYHMEWNGVNIDFINTPGHSGSSVCICINGVLFTGDTLMKGFNPFIRKRHEGSIEEFKNSIKLIFKKFTSDNLVYPGHGECFLLTEVKEFYKNYK